MLTIARSAMTGAELAAGAVPRARATSRARRASAALSMAWVGSSSLRRMQPCSPPATLTETQPSLTASIVTGAPRSRTARAGDAGSHRA